MINIENVEFKTTLELLELLRKYRKYKGFPDTDYQLAKVLGMATSTVHHLLYKGGIMSDETAMQVAKELELPPSYVLLCAWHERNKNQETKDAIKDIAAKYMKVSVFLFAFTVIFNTFTLLHNFI